MSAAGGVFRVHPPRHRTVCYCRPSVSRAGCSALVLLEQQEEGKSARWTLFGFEAEDGSLHDPEASIP